MQHFMESHIALYTNILHEGNNDVYYYGCDSDTFLLTAHVCRKKKLPSSFEKLLKQVRKKDRLCVSFEDEDRRGRTVE